MNILITISFLLLITYSIIKLFKIHRSIILYSKSTGIQVFLIGFAIFLIYLSYKYKAGLIEYLLVILVFLYFVLDSTANGMNHEGITFKDKSRGLLNNWLIKYEDMRVIKLQIGKDIRLESPSSRALIILRFRLEDRERLLDLISNVRVEVEEVDSK